MAVEKLRAKKMHEIGKAVGVIVIFQSNRYQGVMHFVQSIFSDPVMAILRCYSVFSALALTGKTW